MLCYNWDRDVKPLVEEFAEYVMKTPNRGDTPVEDIRFSYISKASIKGRKPTIIFQVHYILNNPPYDRYEDGYIYDKDLERIAEKFSIDFREIIDNYF